MVNLRRVWYCVSFTALHGNNSSRGKVTQAHSVCGCCSLWNKEDRRLTCGNATNLDIIPKTHSHYITEHW